MENSLIQQLLEATLTPSSYSILIREFSVRSDVTNLYGNTTGIMVVLVTEISVVQHCDCSI